MPPNMNESSVSSASYVGSVALTEAQVPQDFSPSLQPAVDQSMLFDETGRKKRLWLVTVPPDTDESELEGAKLKRNKYVSASGNTRFDVTVCAKKEHMALIVHKDLEAAAVRMRVAGTITLREHIDIPELEFASTDAKKFTPIKDARQRFVPFGSSTPRVHSRELPEDGGSKRKKRKKSRK